MEFGVLKLLASLLSTLFKAAPFLINHISNNKKVSNVIGSAIKKAKNKAGVVDRDQYNIPRPLQPSNSDLITLIIRKANDDETVSADVPHFFIGDEFDLFYKYITEDREFWGYLQHKLQEYKLEIIGGKIEGQKSIFAEMSTKMEREVAFLDNISMKIDEQKASTEDISVKLDDEKKLVKGLSERLDKGEEAVEKLLMKTVEERTLIEGILSGINKSIDSVIEEINKPKYPWIKPFSVFAFSEKENESTFRDQNTIATIENKLNTDHVCLIKACEGRGKTILSRIVANDYHDNGFDVFFIDMKDSAIDENDLFSVLKQNKRKWLLVIENVHVCQFLSNLVNTINENKSGRQLFLLNARPTEQEHEQFLMKIGEAIKFNPKIRYSANVARKLCLPTRRIPYVELSKFISEKIYTNQNGNGANLRLLKIYMDIWNNGEGRYSHINEIDENDVLLEFQNKYGIISLKSKEKDALLFLSAIFQFDVPLPKSLLTYDELDFLVDNTFDGIVTRFDYKYHLPHSIDAYYLCKAICHYEGYDYYEKTGEIVKRFIKAMQQSVNPRKYEGEFTLLISGLLARENNYGGFEFEKLIRSLVDWETATSIIKTINPGFVIVAFHTCWHGKEEIRDFYHENKDLWLRDSMLEIYPPIMMKLCLLFIKYIDENIVCDIFADSNNLSSYLERYPWGFNKVFSNSKVKKIVRTISIEHQSVAKKYSKGESVDPIQYQYYFNTRPKNCQGFYEVSQDTIYKNWRKNNVFDIQELQNGFIIKNLNWNGLQKFIKIIQFHINESNRNLALDTVDKIVLMVLRRDVFHYASAYDLSCFLRNVSLVDQSMYKPLITNTKLIQDIEKRLSVEYYDLDDILLFSHFYGKVLFKRDMKKLIENTRMEADEETLSRAMASFKDINAEYYNDFITNTTVIDNVRQRLDFFSYRMDNFYLFSHFYSQEWCKKEMNLLINNANEEQIQVIKEWHDKVLNSLEDRNEQIENDSLLAYIHSKPYCQ